VKLRDAHPGDEQAVAEVHVRAWKVAYRGLLPDDYLDALTPATRAAGYEFGDSGEGSPRTVLALDRGSIVGFSTFGPSRDEDALAAGELYALYIDPERWRSGAGRLLLAETRRRLRQAGHAEAILWVLVGNRSAERFYLADGWRADGGRRWEDPWGVRSEVVRYRRALP